MRRGLENGSRACLELGQRLVDAGAATLTLHPRSAKQMYTGEADHSLTAELVERVDVPVIASGDVTSRARAQTVLATTGAAAVMVGRAAQGNPWAIREIVGDSDEEPTREEVVAELVLFMRETVAGARRAQGDRLPEEVLRLVPRPGPLPAGRSSRSSSSWRPSRRSRSACSPPRRAHTSSSLASNRSTRAWTRSSSTFRFPFTAAARRVWRESARCQGAMLVPRQGRRERPYPLRYGCD